MMSRNNPAIGHSWDEIESEFFTSEEIEESNLKIAAICELIDARNEGYITQADMDAAVSALDKAVTVR